MTSLAEYRMSNTDLNKESILYILTSVTRCFSDAEKKRHGINWCLVMMLGLFIGISVSGCDRKEPVEQRPTAQSAFVQAESVRIQRGKDGDYTEMGTFIGNLSSSGDIIEVMKLPTVYIFRGVPGKYKKYGVKVGNAYLLAEDGFRYLRAVDLSQSDEQIADLFGVKIKKSGADRSKPGKYVLRRADKPWQEHGIRKYVNYHRVAPQQHASQPDKELPKEVTKADFIWVAGGCRETGDDDNKDEYMLQLLPYFCASNNRGFWAGKNKSSMVRYIQCAKSGGCDKSFASKLRWLPTHSELSSLLVDISQSGLSAGLEFDLFKPMAKIRMDSLEVLPIKIRVKGQLSEFREFINSILALPRVVTIHDMSIIPESKNGSPLVMNAMLKTYVFSNRKN